MIVFCGDSFCQPDSYPWNWMSQVAKHYKKQFVSLGKDAVSNFDIVCQVEHAINNIKCDLIVISLTTVDRLEQDKILDSKLVPADYTLMRKGISSNTLTALYRSVTVTDDMLPFIGSLPVNLKKNEIYVEHIINMCKGSGKKFIIFSNIFPVWQNKEYVHRLDYIVDGPVQHMEERDFLPKSQFSALDDKIIERQIPIQDRSCHLTMVQNVTWAAKAISYIGALNDI